MSKYDDYLTEVAYEIDEIMYDYYTRSNYLIAQRRNQDKLINYRDKSIDTVNDMNVRSLQILSSVKNYDLMKERANILLGRNEEILASSLDVINSAPLKSDFLHDVGSFASAAYSGAVEAIDQFSKSDTYESIKENANKGYVKIKDVIENISSDPKVQESINTVKLKSKEVIESTEEFATEAHHKFKEWLDTDSDETIVDDIVDTVEEVIDETIPSDEVLDYVDEVMQHIEEEQEEPLSLVEQAQKQIDKINSKTDLE